MTSPPLTGRSEAPRLPARAPRDDRAEVLRLLRDNTEHFRRTTEEVFRDFVRTAAISLRNRCDAHGAQEREAEYLRIAQTYGHDGMMNFSRALGATALGLTARPCDFLGEIFMEMGAGNRSAGQFFTPHDMSALAAAAGLDGATSIVAAQGFVTVLDPTCGSGSLLVAAVQHLAGLGLDPATQLHLTGQDVSETAVHMAYIHLTLLGAPAVIVQGDTLAGGDVDRWPTAAHLSGGWDAKLAAHSVI